MYLRISTKKQYVANKMNIDVNIYANTSLRKSKTIHINCYFQKTLLDQTLDQNCIKKLQLSSSIYD